MTLPKIILMGGITTAVVAGAGIYLAQNNSKIQSTESLLVDYKELLEVTKDSKTKNSLLINCKNPQKFASQIQALKTKLDQLNKKKNKLININDKTDQDEWIPPLPESKPLEFDKPAPEETQEWIPPLPGSETPDLDPSPSSDKPTAMDNDEWIPPLPGSETPDLEPAPGSDTNSALVEEEFIPRPGSQLPDLGEPAPSSEEEFIPRPGSQVPEFDPTPGNTVIDKINYLEKEIIAELNSLKSLCDNEEKKEIISTSCVDACKKYSDCASYTEGATKEDLQDAYDSCFEECQKWSDKTKICINKKEINAPIDCENLGFCALSEYGGGYSR